MAKHLPRSHAALRRISGVGERKLIDYGDAFIAEIDAFAAASPLPLGEGQGEGIAPW